MFTKLSFAGKIDTIAAFYRPLGNDLKDDEILTEIQVPEPPASARQEYIKFALRKPVDFGIVSVAAVIKVTDGVCHELSIALGGVASAARPLSKNAYKVEIVKTQVKRVLLYGDST